MKILFIQLSDVHFQEHGNSILEKETQLFEAIRNKALDYEEIFFLITGDSAHSGKEIEYKIASNFFSNLATKIGEYSKKKIHLIIIPGNHDCNFDNDTQARKNQINMVQRLGESAVDISVVNQCAEVEKEYFEYQNSLIDNAELVHSDALLSVFLYDFKGKKILFYCYNTAYLSEIKEQAGKLCMPFGIIPDYVFSTKADLIISLFHHPLNWFYPSNRREFATHLQNTCDFYLTGHEHEFSKSQIEDLEDNVVYHIEGTVLQNSEDKFESEFSLIGFDLQSETFMAEKYFWSTDKYQSKNNEAWKNYKRGKVKLKNKYNPTPKFAKFLEDIGGKFTHPNKSEIKLSDLYIYPKLRFFNKQEDTEETITYVLEDSESVLKNFGRESRENKDAKESKGDKVLLFGGESIGKTSLLKSAFKILYGKGFVPVYVQGDLIRNSGIDEFKKLVRKQFIEQYGDDDIQKFDIEDINSVYILVDDVDKSLLKNNKAKARLIKSIIGYYKNIILTGNELYTIEEIVNDEKIAEKHSLYSTFKQYEILEFNHSQRAKLIYRWHTLGQDDFIDEEEVLRKCDNATQAIGIVMANKVVPNYPIFLLILLQTIETTNPHEVNISSYGNYYQLLILKAFQEKIKEQAAVNMYKNYCAELAHFFFQKKTKIISYSEFLKFHSYVTSYDKFDLPSLTSDRALEVICSLGVIERYGDDIEFKYQYTYYYFEAQYLSQNLQQKETKDIISKLCQRVHRTEFANILMFLIHFSNDEYVLTELIKNAQAIFSELFPCKLENDIEKIQDLVNDIPKLYLQDKTVEEVRTADNDNLDKAEQEGNEQEESDELRSQWDLNEDISEIDVVAKLNLSFKLVEILGQILKNNQGGMTGPLKDSMLRETYLIGLRTLNVFFSVLNESTTYIVNQVSELLVKIKNVEKEKVEKVSRHLLFGLCSQISYIFVKKISDSISTHWLNDKYSKIQEEFDWCSVKIVNFLVKLDVTKGFPERELAAIKNDIEKYPLSYYLLKRVVINHLQRHHVDYRDKQRICEFLGIPMESQMKIEANRKKETV